MVDLKKLTNEGEVKNLTGHQRGVKAREMLGFDELDRLIEPVTVKVPETIDALSASFIQGLFAASFARFKSEDALLAHYRFNADRFILKQIQRGLRALNTPRGSDFGAPGV